MNIASPDTLTTAVLALAALTLIALAVVAVQALRRPVLAKVGVRNVRRRPSQSALIVIGLTLSTVIIMSSLSTGDTLNYSVRQQTVAAYGEVDEIIAPPLISTFAGFGRRGAQATVSEQQQALQDLTAGGLTSVLTVLQGGLPGISTEQYARLKAAAEDEPLIDGVAGSILFPTIIRNTTTGQGEPLGFIFAVDQDYDAAFGVTTIDGDAVTMDALKPGVGNIFAQVSTVFSAGQQLAQDAGLTGPAVTGLVAAAAGVGAILTGAADVNLAELSLDVQTLEQLGVDTTPLRQSGIQTVTLETLGFTPERLRALGVTTDSLRTSAILSNTLGLDPAQVAALPAQLLGAVNLNTLGAESDRVLGQFGLQLRQGDVYLNRLGAQRLGAGVGDVLELYIGPIPVPFRVKAIVEEAGPLGAVLPVAMMRLDEAQKLVFMPDRINNVLVSNKGDALAGVEYTAQVSERLRVLAMDEAALAEVVALLRRPDVRGAIAAVAARAPDARFRGRAAAMPAWLRSTLASIIPEDTATLQVKALDAALDQPGISDELRNLMGDLNTRAGLRQLNLPPDAQAELSAALSALNFFDLIEPLSKSTVLAASGVAGGVFTSIFSLFGIFSVFAAVLLIFLIFVMLATERRSEMGISRAIGVQRSHLVQMFVTEGMVYDLLAAALGVALGLLVSYAMVGFIGNLFNDVATQLGAGAGTFQFTFQATPLSVAAAYCLGVLFTFIVVTLASWRVSRLNIVAAIRDLPEEQHARPRSTLNKLARWALGPVMLALGAALAAGGSYGGALVGASLALWGAAVFALRILERTRLRSEVIGRLVYTALGLGLLAVWAVPWSNLIGGATLEQLAQDPVLALLPIVLRGPMIIFGAIMVVMFNADAAAWLVSGLFDGIPAIAPILKTAIAYPLSARFRTGMTMVLFAIIISTVTIMALVIEATQSLIVMSDKDSAGFEIETSNTLLSAFSPLQDMELALPALEAAHPRLADIAVIGSATEQFAEWRATGSGETWLRAPLIAVNDGYIAQAATIYPFKARAAGFDSDAAVWEALRERDDVAIVAPQFSLGNLDAQAQALPERYIEVRVPRASNALLAPNRLDQVSEPRRLQVIGVLADDATRAGGLVQVNRDALTALAGQPIAPGTYYIKVRDGADVRAVQAEVERAFVANGIDASVMADAFALGQNITRGVLGLFQGFMALGLLVGIAALGVITTRSVVERRQQIGVLRAIGFQPHMVAASLMLEASFIAITGLLIGALTGVLLGESIVQGFFSELTPRTQFPVPWPQIMLIVLLAYGFSLLATILPAIQAARIYPAEALRYE